MKHFPKYLLIFILIILCFLSYGKNDSIKTIHTFYYEDWNMTNFDQHNITKFDHNGKKIESILYSRHDSSKVDIVITFEYVNDYLTIKRLERPSGEVVQLWRTEQIKPGLQIKYYFHQFNDFKDTLAIDYKYFDNKNHLIHEYEEIPSEERLSYKIRRQKKYRYTYSDSGKILAKTEIYYNVKGEAQKDSVTTNYHYQDGKLDRKTRTQANSSSIGTTMKYVYLDSLLVSKKILDSDNEMAYKELYYYNIFNTIDSTIAVTKTDTFVKERCYYDKDKRLITKMMFFKEELIHWDAAELIVKKYSYR